MNTYLENILLLSLKELDLKDLETKIEKKKIN
jgi:hypothetical protein